MKPLLLLVLWCATAFSTTGGKVFCDYCGGPFPMELISCPHCGAPAPGRHA